MFISDSHWLIWTCMNPWVFSSSFQSLSKIILSRPPLVITNFVCKTRNLVSSLFTYISALLSSPFFGLSHISFMKIQPNEDSERQANEPGLKDDWQTAKSLLSQLPRSSSETRSLRKQCDEAFAKRNRYFARCRATLLAGERLEDVEPDEWLKSCIKNVNDGWLESEWIDGIVCSL